MRRARLYVGAAAVAALCGVRSSRAQQTPPEKPVLAIPDSLVIKGRADYQLITSGAKIPTYYGIALPVERVDKHYGVSSVATLPALTSKEIYPTPVRHGAIVATAARIEAQNYGNILATVNRVEDVRGWLIAGDGQLGGGYGHVDNAGWNREMANARVRRVLSWRSAFDTHLSVESGQTGIWGETNPSHRTYFRGGGGFGLDETVGGDNQLSVNADASQRTVGGPEENVSEQAFGSVVSWQRASGRFWLHATAKFDFVKTSRKIGDSGTGSNVILSAEAWTRPEENFGGSIGVTVYTVNYLASDSLRTLRPTITAWARPFDNLKLSVRLASGVSRFGIWEAYQQNPLLSLGTPLRSPFRSVDLDANLEWNIDRRNTATFGLRQIVERDYPVWVRKSTQAAWDSTFSEPYIQDQFAIDYGYTGNETASIASFYGRYQYLREWGSVDALGIWRAHTLRGQPVPHVPDWEAHVQANIPVAATITVSPSVNVIGPRRYVLTDTADKLGTLGAYAVFDVQGSKPVWRNWILTVALDNLLNQHYQIWEGFPEPGFHVQIGLRRTW